MNVAGNVPWIVKSIELTSKLTAFAELLPFHVADEIKVESLFSNSLVPWIVYVTAGPTCGVTTNVIVKSSSAVLFGLPVATCFAVVPFQVV